MKNKKILVTGGAGFIGSNLVKKLVDLGSDVTVTVKYKSIIDSVRLAPVWDKLNIVEADLRNTDSVIFLKSLREKYDIIFHLADYNHVGDSFSHVSESLISNLMATANLLEHGPEFENFIYTATSEVYGFQTEVPFKEGNLPFPISPYSVGKYSGELYAKMKKHQTNSNIICLRPFNTFGPYQSERAIIPELIIKCLRSKTIRTTEGKQTREFNYIDNIVDGFIAAGNLSSIPENPINIGSGEEISIKYLVNRIHELTQSKSELQIGALSTRPTEIWRMQADNKRAKNLLGWSSKINFEEGLKLTISWFEKFINLYYGDSGLKNL